MEEPKFEIKEPMDENALRRLLQHLRNYGIKIDQVRPELRERLRELNAMRSTDSGS